MNINNRIITSCGNYRSGSTLIKNIVKELVKEHKQDTHNINIVHQHWMEFKDEIDLTIYSYRDIRDVISSFIEKKPDETKSVYGSWEELLFWGNTSPMNFMVETFIKYDEYIKEYYNNNKGKVLILRYEEIYKKELETIDNICDFLGYSKEKNVDILNNPNNLIRLDYIQTSKTPDEYYKNGWQDHVNGGEIGKYKTVLSSDVIEEINNHPVIRNWLIKNNYI